MRGAWLRTLPPCDSRAWFTGNSFSTAPGKKKWTHPFARNEPKFPPRGIRLFLNSCYFCSLGKADKVVFVFLGFEIWRQPVVKEEEGKSLEESVPDVWSKVWNQGGQGGASLGVSSWVARVFQSSEGQVWLLVGKHGNGSLFKIVLPSFSAHSKSVSSSEIIQRLLIPSYLSTICWDGPLGLRKREGQGTILKGLSAQVDDQVSAVKIKEEQRPHYLWTSRRCCGAGMGQRRAGQRGASRELRGMGKTEVEAERGESLLLQPRQWERKGAETAEKRKMPAECFHLWLWLNYREREVWGSCWQISTTLWQMRPFGLLENPHFIKIN